MAIHLGLKLFVVTIGLVLMACSGSSEPLLANPVIESASIPQLQAGEVVGLVQQFIHDNRDSRCSSGLIQIDSTPRYVPSLELW
jgi:hypothetical protein